MQFICNNVQVLSDIVSYLNEMLQLVCHFMLIVPTTILTAVFLAVFYCHDNSKSCRCIFMKFEEWADCGPEKS